MTINDEPQSMIANLTPIPDPSFAKRVYVKPKLFRYGELRDVTLGPSLGTGESGNPSIYRS